MRRKPNNFLLLILLISVVFLGLFFVRIKQSLVRDSYACEWDDKGFPICWKLDYDYNYKYNHRSPVQFDDVKFELTPYFYKDVRTINKKFTYECLKPGDCEFYMSDSQIQDFIDECHSKGGNIGHYSDEYLQHGGPHDHQYYTKEFIICYGWGYKVTANGQVIDEFKPSDEGGLIPPREDKHIYYNGYDILIPLGSIPSTDFSWNAWSLNHKELFYGPLFKDSDGCKHPGEDIVRRLFVYGDYSIKIKCKEGYKWSYIQGGEVTPHLILDSTSGEAGYIVKGSCVKIIHYFKVTDGNIVKNIPENEKLNLTLVLSNGGTNDVDGLSFSATPEQFNYDLHQSNLPTKIPAGETLEIPIQLNLSNYPSDVTLQLSVSWHNKVIGYSNPLHLEITYEGG